MLHVLRKREVLEGNCRDGDRAYMGSKQQGVDGDYPEFDRMGKAQVLEVKISTLLFLKELCGDLGLDGWPLHGWFERHVQRGRCRSLAACRATANNVPWNSVSDGAVSTGNLTSCENWNSVASCVIFWEVR